MAAAQETHEITFAGSKAKQQQAEHIFNIFRSRGMFMSEDTAIKIPLDVLTAYLEEKEGTKPADAVSLLKANPDVFSIQTIETRYFEPVPVAEATVADGEEDSAEAVEPVEPPEPVEVVSETTWVMTTRAGKAPVKVVVVNDHTFATRLMTPEPKIERPVEPVRERPRVDPSWATYTIPEGLELESDEEFGELDDLGAVADVPAAAPVEAVELPEPDVAAPVVAEPEPAAPEAEIEEPVAAVAEVPEAEAESPVTEPVAAEAAPEVVTTPPIEMVAAVKPEAAATTSGVIDAAAYDDEAMAAAIESELGADARAAVFGSLWMAEDRVPRLSRGDLRRVKDYIEEQEQPLTDATLVQDILNVRPNSVDFPVLQFAVNYRLSKEHRDFEFVGTNDQRFWNTNSSQQIGTTRRKPNEIGTDYRYLVEQVGDVAPRSIASLDHILTFYEFSLGLLPFDEDLQRLLPKPLTLDQKSAVLTFEFPQAYATYLVELRYPTPNRGGFLLGLDDFYADNLVPGAMISISATENDGHYKVEFLPGENQTARLLELDDRRSPRYLFRPTTFSCTVDDKWQISEDRFPRLGTEKPLDDRIRRRPEAVVEATFERVGIEDGSNWTSTFDDLLAAVNIERPISAALLREILEQSNSITDEGSDTFTYVTGS
jgi:hypothetical protein